MIHYLTNPDDPSESVVAYDDCPACAGRGLVMGGDEYRGCPRCRLRYQDYTALLDATDREHQRAKDWRYAADQPR